MKEIILFTMLFMFQSNPQSGFTDVSMESLPLLDLGSNSMDVAFADLDNDDDLDIIIASEYAQNLILENDGSGKFTYRQKALPQKRHDSEDIAVADFNGDGLLDIIFVSEDDQTNEYYIQQGSYKFEDKSKDLSFEGISNAIAHGDIDNDGDIDIVVGNAGQNFLYLNNGKGNFRDASHKLPQITDTTQDVELGDVNSDGWMDLLVGNETKNYLHVYDPNTDSYQSVDLPHREGVIEETRDVDFVDIDNDGDLDIFFSNVLFSNPTNKDPSNRILINKEGKFVDESLSRILGSNENQSLDTDFYDLDKDGDLDAVIANAFGTRHQVLINENGVLNDSTSEFFEQAATMGVDVEIGDLNGDGLPDLYFGTFKGADYLYFSK